MTTDPMRLLDHVLDPGSWRCWDGAVVDPDPDSEYAADLRLARARTGWDESVRTGEGTVHGRPVAVLLSEFRFLAGSIGVAAGARLVRAIRRATAAGLPLLASPSSGGTRMQEGATAFLQMAAVTTALREHRSSGLPFLVYLRHPTTGGVLASWGSLGHLTAAEPGALIGFLGPRVYAALAGEPFPPGVQTAENLRDHGLIDAVLSPHELRAVVTRVVAVTTMPPTEPRPGAEADDEVAARSDELPRIRAAEMLARSRRSDRPGVRALLRRGASHVTVFHATGSGERDEAMVVALARLDGASCVIVGQDRVRQRERALHPAGLRAARRGMRLANDLGLPLVTIVDTPGAELSKDAEESGLAGEIARCLDDLIALPVPTVSVLLGEGAGGAALALFPADATLAAQHAWLSPLVPEGASVIVHRTTEHAARMAELQHIGARDLLERGVLDGVVRERPDAADEPDAFVRRIAAAIRTRLDLLAATDRNRRLHTRQTRYTAAGLPGAMPGDGTDAPRGI